MRKAPLTVELFHRLLPAFLGLTVDGHITSFERLVWPTGPALKKAVKDRVTGMVCLPAWRAAAFKHLVASDGAHINRVLKRVVRGRPRLVARDDIQSDTFRSVVP